MSTYTFRPLRQGAVTLHLATVASLIEVRGTTTGHASVEVETDETDGPLIDYLERLRPEEDGDMFGLDLTNLPATIVINGGVQYGSHNVQVNNFGGSVTAVGRGSVAVGSNYGVINTGSGMSIGSPSLRVVATVPFGSTGMLESVSGRISTKDVARVRANNVSGAVVSRGLVHGGRFTTVSGTVTVGAADGARPEVEVKTVSGDLIELDDRVVSRFRSISGHRIGDL